MLKESQDKYLDALCRARQEYAKRSFMSIVDVSGGRKLSDSELALPYCGNLYKVNYPQGEITKVVDVAGQLRVERGEIQITDRILILQYLAEVSGIIALGKWISFLELPGGPHHYQPFALEAIEPVARRFASEPGGFTKACKQLGGLQSAMADRAFIIPALPRIALMVQMWFGDEEFPPRANILFEGTACLHLNTAGLYMLGINTAKKLIAQAE